MDQQLLLSALHHLMEQHALEKFRWQAANMLRKFCNDPLRVKLVFFVHGIGQGGEIRIGLEGVDLHLGNALVVEPLRIDRIQPQQGKDIFIVSGGLFDGAAFC